MASSSSSAPQYVTNGSVYPKEKKHVSTMVGEKIVEEGKKMAEARNKVVKSTVSAIKKHNNMGKMSPDI
ncbi:Hypothetical predicted protein [Olea europaea subsp. europaea]|uniref:Uncharacterized protein n=1 Tax=Olea europaea subsp. europaea TaxID=158383 RepID=A0A8S0QUN3_OLEEU|nr:Hypothetical predicted protein [Olea europaea subsp. europaea]